MIKFILKYILLPIIILFFVLYFWKINYPRQFFDFWSKYPITNNLFEIACDNCKSEKKAFTSTSSETVSADSGQIVFANNIWNVEIARDENSRTRGLSNRSFLDRQTGMLFVFDTLDYHGFWMKGTLIYLDMVFLDENWKIVEIAENISPATFPKIFGGEVKSKYVLEINGGEAETYGLKVGDQLIFLNN